MKNKPIILLLLIIPIFLFVRLYNLPDSFFFYNDMGRDMTVLQLWQQSGKPPLLGTQTSALPFNQSAIYFYLLYPGFLISQGSPLSLVYTLAAFYIFVFSIVFYIYRKEKIITKTLLIVFFLISIHPQYIAQGRYVWNPSFVSPLIFACFSSFYLLINKFSKLNLWVFSFSLAAAISLSYSIAPLFISLLLYWFVFNRQNFISLFSSLFTSFFILNVPTIAFELKHKFLLTTALLTQKNPSQELTNFNEKIISLSQYVFSTPLQSLNIIFLILTIVLCLWVIIKKIKEKKSLQFISAFTLLTLLIQSLVIPITIRAHYLFAVYTLLFILISTLNKTVASLIILTFLIFYLQPVQLNSYFKKAPRTYQEMTQCFKDFCLRHQQPTFVSVQSDFHPYHNGPEHRYLMKKLDCDVKDIETENGSTKYMSVILDNGNFDNKTNYYELEQFGKFKDIETFDCLPNFKIKVLEKI